MDNIRSGLIIESIELASLGKTQQKIKSDVKNYDSCKVTTVYVINKEHAKALGKEIGEYITVEFEKAYQITDSDFDNVVDVLASEISRFTNCHKGKRVLVAGIGNKNITADSIGPKSIERIIVTRALENTEFISSDCFGNVSAISADVFGVTGVESAELIKGLSYVLNPSLIIVIDALATTSLSRLCKTVQISNTAITPGGGVDNARQQISSTSLDVPMLSIGMPTVIDVESITKIKDKNLIVTPVRIDDATDVGAKMIAFALNKALHNNLSTEDILKFLY